MPEVNDPGHFALDQSLRLLGVLHLIGHRDAVALRDQLRMKPSTEKWVINVKQCGFHALSDTVLY